MKGFVQEVKGFVQEVKGFVQEVKGFVQEVKKCRNTLYLSGLRMIDERNCAV